MISVRVQVRTPNLDATRKTLAGMGRTPPPPAIAQMYDEWAFLYGSFIRRRYNTFSRGGGNWPPLKQATIGARRVGTARSRAAAANSKGDARSSLAFDRRGALVRADRKVSILKDTGQLFNALSINARGNVKKYVPYGVRFGIGGPARHAAIKRALAAGKGANTRGTNKGDANRQKLAQALRGQRSGSRASGRRTGAITIGRLAAIHDQGLGHNPKREIIVPPDAATLRRMSRIASATMHRTLTGGAR